MTLDIIISINNLEKTIESIYNKLEDELKNIKYNLIFIDNASTDKSFDILKNIQEKNDLCVKIISLSKKVDKDTCIYAGLLHSKHELICIYDIENNTQISQIIKMYDYLLKHKEYDQVCLQTNYTEENFIQKNKLKLFNKIYDMNFDYNKSYSRIMKKSILNAVIESSENKPFSVYAFNDIGFNTYYLKCDNKKIDKINYNKLIEYSKCKGRLYKCLSLALLLITFIYLFLIIFNLFNINNNVILLFILLSDILNIYLYGLSLKKHEKTIFLIKERIGFEENVL